MSVAKIAAKGLAKCSEARYVFGMEPASNIIKTLGGAANVAKITGVHRTRVYGWMRPKAVGGTGGVIPMAHIPTLIEAAEKAGACLTGDDFIPKNERGAA